MRILGPVTPSAEQLPILGDIKPGFRVIRGAGGSGKTTTALLRLKQLCASRLSRRTRMGATDPVRVLVLTYNTTLQGYIAELARTQVAGDPGLILTVSTFSKWARELVGDVKVLDHTDIGRILRPRLEAMLPPRTSLDYYIDEVEYVLSMFLPNELPGYLTLKREGRGAAPRIDGPLRRRLLDEVIRPYVDEKAVRGVMDWNDLAVTAIDAPGPAYDVVIVDEAQDFSANQVRAVLAHISSESSVTFVIDAMQRIYPRHFTWSQVGVPVHSSQVYRLTRNHRNTKQIAAFARPLVEGLPLEDDGSLPDFDACEEEGPLPQLVAGTYSAQIDYMLDQVIAKVDLASESVAILQPRGGGWFAYTRKALRSRGIPFCELTRQSEWPAGTANVGLSTIHSAKGLEFDHVLLPGLNQEVTPHGDEEGDGSLEGLRRLLAMGVVRARRSVLVGYKPGEESTLVSLIDPETYEEVTL
jgi:superfamily I DNA/RNA helicase